MSKAKEEKEEKEEPENKKPSQAETSPAKGGGSKGRKREPQDLELEEPEEEVELEETEEIEVPGLEVVEVVEEEGEEEEILPPRPSAIKRQGAKELAGSEPAGFQDRFSTRSRTLFVDTKVLAGKLGHDCATTGHLLAAILAEDTGVAPDIFSDVNAYPEMFEEEMARIREIPAPPSGHWFDPGVELAVKRGLDAADVLESEEMEPEHMLLGLLSLKDGPAAEILSEFSLDRVDMRDEILGALGADIDRFPDWERGKNLRRRPRRS